MNTEESSIAANRKAWENAVSSVLQKLNLPDIQCEIEPGIIVDPIYSADNAPDPIVLPVDHIPQPPEVILSMPSGALSQIKEDLTDLALDKIHVSLQSLEDIQEMNVFNSDAMPYQLQLGDPQLISHLSSAQRSEAEALFSASPVEDRMNGLIFIRNSVATPSDQLKEIILTLIEIAGRDSYDHREIHLLVEIGPNYTLEIARLRALHLLIDHLWRQKNFKLSHQPKPNVQALCKVQEDDGGLREKGLIEMTTKCMAATAGMVHGLVLEPQSQDFSYPDQIYGYCMIPRILQHESDWFKTVDPMAGSYWIECVTAKLAEKAWAKIGKAKRGN